MVKLLDLQAITMMQPTVSLRVAGFYKVMKTSSLRKTMLNILVQMSV